MFIKRRFDVFNAAYVLIIKREEVSIDLPSIEALEMAHVQELYSRDILDRAATIFFVENDGRTKFLKSKDHDWMEGKIEDYTLILFEDTPQKHDFAPLRWAYEWFNIPINRIAYILPKTRIGIFFENCYFLEPDLDARNIYKSNALVDILLLEMRVPEYAGKMTIPFRYEEFSFTEQNARV